MEDDYILSLEWPNFEIFLGYTFQELRHDTNLCDVTLVCEKNERITAHKLLLSASSLFFMKLFLNKNQNKQLEFDMKGFDFKTLSFVMDFIYTGEVKLHKSELAEFLTTTKELELKGLKPRTEKKEGEIAEPETKTENSKVVIDYSSCMINEIKPYIEETVLGILETNPKNQVVNIYRRKPRLGQPKKSRTCCQQFFSSYKPWKKHDLQVHPKEMNRTNCGKSLKTENYRRHVIECTGVGSIKCSNCSYMTSMKWMLKNHMIRRHLNPTKPKPSEDIKPLFYNCSKCDYVAKSNKSARNHKNMQHSGILYSCTECRYDAKTRTNLKHHKDLKHAGVRYGCGQCEREFPRPKNLRDHISSAHEGRRIHCDHCDITFTDKSNLNTHTNVNTQIQK